MGKSRIGLVMGTFILFFLLFFNFSLIVFADASKPKSYSNETCAFIVNCTSLDHNKTVPSSITCFLSELKPRPYLNYLVFIFIRGMWYNELLNILTFNWCFSYHFFIACALFVNCPFPPFSSWSFMASIQGQLYEKVLFGNCPFPFFSSGSFIASI